jgi:hypothetical protein
MSKDEKQRENSDDSEQVTRNKEKFLAMGGIGAKLGTFDLPLQTRDMIFRN